MSGPQLWQQLREVLLLSLFLLAALSWLATVIYTLRIPFNAAPGSRLKERGLRARVKPEGDG